MRARGSSRLLNNHTGYAQVLEEKQDDEVVEKDMHNPHVLFRYLPLRPAITKFGPNLNSVESIEFGTAMLPMARFRRKLPSDDTRACSRAEI